MGNSQTASVAFEAVACVRGGRLVFESVSFALGPGEAAIVTGPNGVGKSSLLRIAAGLLAPAAGRIALDGRVAWLGEAAALDRGRTLCEALGFWARVDESADGALAHALELMTLAHLAEVPVRLLSTGQRRRAGLARVIASGASIWLLDEPGSGLDAAALERLDAAMAGHRAAGGIVLAATHQPLGLAAARIVALAAAE